MPLYRNAKSAACSKCGNTTYPCYEVKTIANLIEEEDDRVNPSVKANLLREGKPIPTRRHLESESKIYVCRSCGVEVKVEN